MVAAGRVPFVDGGVARVDRRRGRALPGARHWTWMARGNGCRRGRDAWWKRGRPSSQRPSAAALLRRMAAMGAWLLDSVRSPRDRLATSRPRDRPLATVLGRLHSGQLL